MIKYYYVLVCDDDGPKFVTDVKGRDAFWNDDEVPLGMSETRAEDVASGLRFNGFNAYTVFMGYELGFHPYNYKDYKVEFVKKDSKGANAVLLQFNDYGSSANDKIQVWYTVYLTNDFELDDLKDLVSMAKTVQEISMIDKELGMIDEELECLSFYEHFEKMLIEKHVEFINVADPKHYLLYEV